MAFGNDMQGIQAQLSRSLVVRNPAQDPTKAELAQQQVDIDRIIHQILQDVERASWQALNYPSTYDPFQPVETTFNTMQGERYATVNNYLGRNYTVVAWYSGTFRSALNYETDDFFKDLMTQLEFYKDSLLMIAVTNGLKPLVHYNNSSLAAIYPLAADAFAVDLRNALNLEHPHEAYLAEDMSIQRCHQVTDDPNTTMMRNNKENIYRPENFYGFEREDGWPSGDGWPTFWGYPHDPSDPAAEFLRRPRCINCQALAQPMEIDGSDCGCRIQNTLLEIRQHTFMSRNPRSLSKGVRLLKPVREGDIIGEYTGEFIPFSQEGHNKFLKDGFKLDFRGPPLIDAYDGLISGRDEVGYTSTLMSGEFGNWAKFLNRGEAPHCNVKIEHAVFNRKNRILIRATRDINIGDELTICSADDYFDDEEFAPGNLAAIPYPTLKRAAPHDEDDEDDPDVIVPRWKRIRSMPFRMKPQP